MEMAFAHGYLSARVEGYADRRARERRRRRFGPVGSTGPNLSGWQQLAALVESRHPDRLVRASGSVVH